MKDTLDDIFILNRRQCNQSNCPSLETLELYARGFYKQIDERDFNNVEDCLNLYQCPFALRYIEERRKNNPIENN